MLDIIPGDLWVGLAVLTLLLYTIKWIQGRKKNTIYRISPESLKRSKRVMLGVLPLLENNAQGVLDEERLPYPKENIKSAAKILAYFYWKENRQEELMRVKNCFIGLARFQNPDLELETREKRLARDRKKLTREFECYITHSSRNTRAV